ncbi:opioid-binding protein/cell adhesion molecule homolog isoform X1 [Lutzomyia longipalpis]|uniref:opioid-binding protein/cell adhesion molecule homolog isoform X1 n=1 Tax=Lutzomyia longipalpis TaxID=7200 RepID=UPI00248426F2|nr:opioid-binding protein/cell adhesion molecule homolog isoform X1 [Lutzomyia longipalpis]
MRGLSEIFFAQTLFLLNGIFMTTIHGDEDLPKFGEPIQNVTVPIGREATLSCTIDNLQTYKIAWLRVDTQTILTIQNHVITKNHRMSITHAEKRSWVLKIRDVKESDKGWYMCQINTDPMKNQVGYLDVVVPPDILDYPTSTDMVVREGSNVTLKCAATGSPTPTITWRREGGEPISLAGGKEVTSFNGSVLTIPRVNRLNMGAYLCIASNGIPPTISKRVMLIVHFPPMIWIQNQLVGAALGQSITLDCQSEAFPKSINYWMLNDTIITPGERHEPTTYENTYRVVMRLTIKRVENADFGSYKCVAKNSLGDTDGAIKLYHIPHSTLLTTYLPTTAVETTPLIIQQQKENPEDRATYYKSTAGASVAVNKILIGSTSGSWNSDGRERDHRHRFDSVPSTEVQRDVDLITKEQYEASSKASKASQHPSQFQWIHLMLLIVSSVASNCRRYTK